MTSRLTDKELLKVQSAADIKLVNGMCAEISIYKAASQQCASMLLKEIEKRLADKEVIETDCTEY